MTHSNRQKLHSYQAAWCGQHTGGKGCPWDLDWLERRTHRNLMKFTKATHKVLNLGQGNLKHQDREWTERD